MGCANAYMCARYPLALAKVASEIPVDPDVPS